LKLFNTLTQTVEPFSPRSGKVNIYVCGITPYDTTHLGHAFTYTSVDILIRYLQWMGLKVRYVQNVTDIDDDILRKAREAGDDWQEIGNRWTTHFIRDMQSLNVRPPDYFPRATSVIPEIIQTIIRLVDQGVGYVSAGNVYYDVHSWPDFGKLSRLPKEDMLPVANERGNRPDDPHKKNPLDFVLWQAQAPGEPAWDSPWGPGRPGWHIECSTMSTKFLGSEVDIHGGGADLCFPHHESEIAQIEPLLDDRSFVRFWMHTAMVHHEGEKMSKSLGNLVMIRELLRTYSADAIRLYLGSHHYRSSWEFDEQELQQAAHLVGQIQQAVTAKGGQARPLESEPAWASFTSAMDNDQDTPGAVSVLSDLTGQILSAQLAGRDIREAQTALLQFAQLFGLRLDQPGPETEVLSGWERYIPAFAPQTT
jgi:L-cysteine:1D-myo-inositol 2-amino-2-deoxy-alpha-D-glucopyranoside ligase